MKKPKPVLTPEETALRKAQRKETLKLGFRQGIVPFLIQIGILAFVVLFFVFVIANDANPDLLNVPLRPDEANDPNVVRLIYMILCFPAIFFLLKWAGKIKETKWSFWPALVAGILLWQAVGECSWHFGLWENGVFVFFPRLEGPQGLFVVLIVLPFVLYVAKKYGFSWVMKVFVLSFLINWLTHFVLLGLAPMWPTTAIYHNPTHWPKIAGFVFGLHGTLMLLYRLLFKCKTLEERYVTSIMLYGFVGMFIEGAFGVGGSLE